MNDTDPDYQPPMLARPETIRQAIRAAEASSFPHPSIQNAVPDVGQSRPTWERERYAQLHTLTMKLMEAFEHGQP